MLMKFQIPSEKGEKKNYFTWPILIKWETLVIRQLNEIIDMDNVQMYKIHTR